MKHKTSLFIALLFAAFSSSAFTVKNINASPLQNHKYTMKTVMGGDWLIGSYTDGKSDLTGSVSAYTFTFNGDGSINIQHGGAAGVPGQYQMSGSTMTLGFYEPELTSMNGDWKILAYTDTEIKLARDNSVLDFVRNPNPGNPSDLD